jgi:hypothetical protein
VDGMTAPTVKQIGLFWFIVNAPGGAFYGTPWPTKADAQEILRAVLAQAAP